MRLAEHSSNSPHHRLLTSAAHSPKNYVQASFIGAMAIDDLVKSALGPKGMDKILQLTGRGRSINFINDGSTILKSLHIDNHAAKVLAATDFPVSFPASFSETSAADNLRRGAFAPISNREGSAEPKDDRVCLPQALSRSSNIISIYSEKASGLQEIQRTRVEEERRFALKQDT